MDNPSIGDIWVDNGKEYVMFLEDPIWGSTHLCATVLTLNSGETEGRTFYIDEKTGGMHDWWKKVA